MGFLNRLSSNPMVLLACVIGGGLMGWFLPSTGIHAVVLGQIYLALINMAALPLLVVATFFGLRQTLSLPQPGRRSLMILAFALGLVFVCAFIGTALGFAVGAGKNLNSTSREYLGSMVQVASGDAANVDVSLYAAEPVAQEKSISPWSSIVPSNFFRVLVDGSSLGILMCAIFFGLAFAALAKNQTNALMGIFEAIYRAMELIISRVNVYIPLLALGMAAYFVAKTDSKLLYAMGSFLATFIIFSFILSSLAIVMIWKRSGLAFYAVISALKAPILISLTSASSTSTIPDTIEAMSSKLGFSRGIVELVMPTSSVFMRSGAALYFSLLAVFVANLYEYPLMAHELLLICLGAFAAAFASAGNNGLAVVGFAGIVLSLLNLPVEAAFAIFLAIDLLCEGPRNLLTLLFSCLLVVLVSRGLPSERIEIKAPSESGSQESIRFAFSKASALMFIGFSLLVAALITVVGIGVGMDRVDVIPIINPQ